MENTENNTITDIDGNTYNLVQIGKQLWTAENLNVSKYRNGDEIPEVTNLTEWAELTTGAWCYYSNDSYLGKTYGKLYNWYALNDPRGLAPEGFKIPSDEEWNILINFLGGEDIAGGKMKPKGKNFWKNPNVDASNSSGFTGLPGGGRYSFDQYLGYGGNWWTSTEISIEEAIEKKLASDHSAIRNSQREKYFGISVRCIKETDEKKESTNKESNKPSEVLIGTQLWSTQNLDVSNYRNGDVIPQVQDAAEWANLKTGAWCYYENLNENGTTYGKLYNGFAVNDPRGLAPEGCIIPSDLDITILMNYLGGARYAGGKMKEVGKTHWGISRDNTNTSGFTGLPGGYRFDDGSFGNVGQQGRFWTSSECEKGNRFYFLATGPEIGNREIGSDFSFAGGTKVCGFSIRCFKYPTPPKIENNIVTDLDGKGYKGIQIGTQLWIAENLNVSKYRNGDEIPQVQDAAEWAALTTGAWCYYENKDENGTIYGKLYNWFAVNDPRGLAPEGFHIPSDGEWTTLTDYLGGKRIAGSQLMETGITHWERNPFATNSSGFTGLPGGFRKYDGSFDQIGCQGVFWCKSEYRNNRTLSDRTRLIHREEGCPELTMGISIRCLKD